MPIDVGLRALKKQSCTATLPFIALWSNSKLYPDQHFESSVPSWDYGWLSWSPYKAAKRVHLQKKSLLHESCLCPTDPTDTTPNLHSTLNISRGHPVIRKHKHLGQACTGPLSRRDEVTPLAAHYKKNAEKPETLSRKKNQKTTPIYL